MDDALALTRALAEALERYCACVYSDQQFIWATADELGTEALALDHVPRCSERELAHPACPLRLPDRTVPIRWVRGLSLLTREQTWLPAVMVYLRMPRLSMGEEFILPTSTGCAAHVNVVQALVSAICEVIERDAAALVWLQQLALPRIDIDQVTPNLTPYVEASREGQAVTYFFNATTELGIPTIYGVDCAPSNRELATLVACATDLDPVQALSKVVSDLVAYRAGMEERRNIPATPDLFDKGFHGVKYMGRPEHQAAFCFLQDSPRTCQLSSLSTLDKGNPAQNLTLLLQRLHHHAMQAFAVDLTTDEALQAGMRVVRVLIPQLHPLTFGLRARYLAHPRLYDAPRSMGYPVRSEDEINPWPQPFG